MEECYIANAIEGKIAKKRPKGGPKLTLIDTIKQDVRATYAQIKKKAADHRQGQTEIVMANQSEQPRRIIYII